MQGVKHRTNEVWKRVSVSYPIWCYPSGLCGHKDNNSIAVTASRANSLGIQPADLYLMNLTDGEIVKVGATQDEYCVAWKPLPK